MQQMRCVRLGTRKLGAEGGARCCRSDERDHTLVYFEGDPRDHTAGFELCSGDELEGAGALLSDAGVPVRAGSARVMRAGYPFDEASQRPRQFRPGPESSCMWGSKPDIPEFSQ